MPNLANTSLWCSNNQYNGTRRNDTHHYGFNCEAQNKHRVSHCFIVMLSVILVCVVMLSAIFLESSASFRPTQRSKLSTTTSSTSSASIERTSTSVCDEAPHILGFDGPLKPADIGINIADVGNDESSVFYRCNGGRVVDVHTNRRVVRLLCNDVARFRSPKKWPKCKKPTHCVGPARKPGKAFRFWAILEPKST